MDKDINAIGIVRQMIVDGQVSQDVAEKYFPELKESEDEGIRKELISLFQDCIDGVNHRYTGSDSRRWLAWLEKQREHANFRNKIQVGDKVTRNEDGVLVNLSQLNRVAKKQGEQNLADKVEPKFHEGEWITNGDYTWKIVEVKPLDYILQSLDGNIVDDTISHVDEQFHSFTIQDAKDGDVLASDNSIFIFQEEYIAGKPVAYCGLMNGLFIEGNAACWTNKKCYPATKEQCDFLFQKMKKADYEWNAEKKELRKIEQKHTVSQFTSEQASVLDEHIDKFLEKKSVWSEKYIADVFEKVGLAKIVREQSNDSLTNALQDAMLELSKFLPQQNLAEEYNITGIGSKNAQGKLGEMIKNLKPVNKVLEQGSVWSEEDEENFKGVMDALNFCNHEGVNPYDIDPLYLVSWLKSLKERYTWKPSDEQIVCLHDAVARYNREGFSAATLTNLLEQLEKLREE